MLKVFIKCAECFKDKSVSLHGVHLGFLIALRTAYVGSRQKCQETQVFVCKTLLCEKVNASLFPCVVV